jgi:hypothetical protein
MIDKRTLLPRLADVVNNRKNYAWGTVLLAGLFLAGSLMRSPESQANSAFSSPVTVMNTTTGPANTLDAGLSSRIPYVSTASVNCGSGINECGFLFTAAPAGFRLVIETISGEFKLSSGVTTPPNGILFFNTASEPEWGFSAPIGPTNGPTFARFSQPITAYADPSDGQPIVDVDATFTSTAQRVTLSGYLINCSLTPCPAIQH